ncbi:MAG: hypothetical protein CMO26_21265 [Thiotrichales bacterium]|nr:hypothetical protein [Thiotrichales bacterium]
MYLFKRGQRSYSDAHHRLRWHTSMSDFNLDEFIQAARDAAVSDSPTKATLALMKKTLAEPDSVAANMGDYQKDDVVLFEDSTVSIWYVRFQPGTVVPPHDHQIPTFIGVYSGVEENRLYRVESEGLNHVSTRNIGAGEVLSIGPNGIHAVQAVGETPSEAIHVYLGKLTTIERSLFDWETGQARAFTDDAYDELVRTV